jgi:hypothetical protein
MLLRNHWPTGIFPILRSLVRHQGPLAGVELTTFGLQDTTATVRPRDEDPAPLFRFKDERPLYDWCIYPILTIWFPCIMWVTEDKRVQKLKFDVSYLGKLPLMQYNQNNLLTCRYNALTFRNMYLAVAVSRKIIVVNIIFSFIYILTTW